MPTSAACSLFSMVPRCPQTCPCTMPTTATLYSPAARNFDVAAVSAAAPRNSLLDRMYSCILSPDRVGQRAVAGDVPDGQARPLPVFRRNGPGEFALAERARRIQRGNLAVRLRAVAPHDLGDV